MSDNSIGNRHKYRLIFAVLAGFVFFVISLIYMYLQESKLVFLIYSDKPVSSSVNFFTQHSDAQATKNSVQFYTLEKNYKTVRANFPVNPQLTDSVLVVFDSTDANFSLCYVLVKKPGFHPVQVPLTSIRAGENISINKITNILYFNSLGHKSVLSFAMPVINYRVDFVILFLLAVFSFLLSLVVYYYRYIFSIRRYRLHNVLIYCGFVVVVVIVSNLALKAGFNASPDERDHFMAAEFYKSHSISPQKHTETGAYTYNSLWNYSRVYNRGINYLLAGKFSNLFDGYVDSFRSVRFFGIFLIIFCLLICLYFPRMSLLFLPFFFTPQVWYLFSYVNDDYFPLFIAFVLLFVSEVFKTDLLANKLNKSLIIKVLIIGVVYGLMLLSKKNYLLFSVFYPFYLFSLPLKFSGECRLAEAFKAIKKFIRIPFAVIVIALMVVGLRQTTFENSVENNLSKDTEAFYNQSQTNLNNHKAKGISGRERFASYFTMMKNGWIITSFKSFCGVYGFMKYRSANWYYNLFTIAYGLLIIVLFVMMIKSRDKELIYWSFILFAFFVSVIFAASYIYSYLHDYQAQGRYVFPVLPVLGLFLHKVYTTFTNRKIVTWSMILLMSIFMLSLYSFIFIGTQALT